MNTKNVWILVEIIVVVAGVFIVKDYLSPQQFVKDQDSVKIGAILSETGVAAAFGEMSRKGIELAVQEINQEFGTGSIEVVFEDDLTDPKAAAGAYHKLVGIDKVDAIIGSNFDFVTQPIFSLAQEGGTVVISPSNPRIPGAFDTNDYSFVMMSEFDDIVRAFKIYLGSTPHTQLGILRFESSFAEQIQTTLDAIEKELGNKSIVSETYKQIGNNDFRTQILKLKQAGVDLVFLDMIAIDPYTFVTQAKQLGYSPRIISHVGIQDALSIPDIDPKIFDGVVSVNWNVTTDDFAKRFGDAYGIKPDKSANRAYDAMYILFDALKQAQKDKSKLVSVLESTTFTTPNGAFTFTDTHAAVSTPVRLEIVRDGKLVPYQK